MNKDAAYRTALVIAAMSLTILLDACVCRPIRIDRNDYKTPETLAELKASLP